MFYKADSLIFSKAKELRKKLTAAEQTFWLRLKEKFPEYKFRKQHPISIYIADFYCHKRKLIIEIDGSVHESDEAKLNEEKRQNDLENLGLIVIRFTNNQVKNRIELVVEEISSTIEKVTGNKRSSS